MAVVRYTIRTSVCPHCQHKLARGQRRFGPAQVRCSRCGSTLQTGLDEWARLPILRKALSAVGEILFPSWIGVAGCTGVIVGVITQLFLWVIVPAPLYVIVSVLDPNLQSTAAVLALVAGQFLYPLLLVIRLARMVRESQTYTRTQEPPVWGQKPAEGKVAANQRYLDKRYRVLLRLLAVLLAGAWIAGIVIVVSGFSRSFWLAGVCLAASYLGGAVVAAELSRCLGQTRRSRVTAVFVVLVAAPIALPVLAILRHRVTNLIATIKRNHASVQRGRASNAEITALMEASNDLAGTRDPTAVEPLIRALKDRDGDIRSTVAAVLGEIGDEQAVPHLTRALQDEDSRVRAAATDALRKIAGPPAQKEVLLYHDHLHGGNKEKETTGNDQAKTIPT